MIIDAAKKFETEYQFQIVLFSNYQMYKTLIKNRRLRVLLIKYTATSGRSHNMK